MFRKMVVPVLLALPLAASVALWMGHERLPDFITMRTKNNYRLLWLPAHVMLVWDRSLAPVPVGTTIPDPNVHLSLLGVGYHHQYYNHGGLDNGVTFYPRGSYTRYLTLPYWFLAAVATLPPAFWLWRRLRRSPVPPNACATCRYDLRAHQPGDRCPECGTVIGPRAGA
jgi:hypothetical protein